MAKTRAKKPAPKSQSHSSTTEAAAPKHVLEPSETHPPKLFILPRDASPDSRILTLPHPASSKPTRYFVDPAKGFYEFTHIAAPKKACRSVLSARDAEDMDEMAAGEQGDEGYILQQPSLFIATPIDPVFILLPALAIGFEANEYCTFHDMLFLNSDGAYKHLESIFRASEAGKALEKKMEDRVKEVCKAIEMGDETSYQINNAKLASLIRSKALRMVTAGLPASMEEHFVRKPLEVPEVSVKRQDSALSIVEEGEGDVPAEAAQLVAEDDTQKTAHLRHLLRLRTAIKYLYTNYLPPTLMHQLQHESPLEVTDFTALDQELARIAKLKAEAVALRSISDNISRKRGMLDDEEAIERAETKKRKKEEEEARKKNMSRGVKALGKVDTKGMKKMSAFFGKKS